MKPLNLKGRKVFSFLLGLIYGYRRADIELKIFPMDKFSPPEKGRVYYLNRKNDDISFGTPLREFTHIVVLKENKENRKLEISIYKS